jgi:cell wall-associated NlpC family hydrolase
MGARHPTKFALVAVVPLALCGLLLVLGRAGANGTPADVAGCAGGGTAQQLGEASLDPEQIGNARTIIDTVATRRLPPRAAVIAVATALQESSLRNSTVMLDHDSIGLFQQRISIYTAAVAADPVRATDAFLDRLLDLPDWERLPLADAAARVQKPRADLRGAYARWQRAAERLVAQLWTTAAPADPKPPDPEPPADVRTTAASMAPTAAICPNDGAGPGDVVSGTATVPAGLEISGSPRARPAVRFALAHLGEPYVFGAAGPNTWDCSGLTMAAWAATGIALPHWTGAQVTAGTPEPTDLSQAVGGDLVFIPGADGTPAVPGHVGMIIGYTQDAAGRHLYLVQAPQSGDVVKITDAARWGGRITDVRHIA